MPVYNCVRLVVCVWFNGWIPRLHNIALHFCCKLLWRKKQKKTCKWNFVWIQTTKEKRSLFPYKTLPFFVCAPFCLVDTYVREGGTFWKRCWSQTRSSSRNKKSGSFREVCRAVVFFASLVVWCKQRRNQAESAFLKHLGNWIDRILRADRTKNMDRGLFDFIFFSLCEFCNLSTGSSAWPSSFARCAQMCACTCTAVCVCVCVCVSVCLSMCACAC